MSKKQVSIRGATYDRVRAHCEKEGLSVAEFIDGLCGEFFGNGGVNSLPADRTKLFSDEEKEEIDRQTKKK